MADEPQEALGGKTPLEHAATPHMDALAAGGRLGRVRTVPEGMHPGSDVANMSLMGYDPAVYYTGRAPIEAAGMGVALAEDDTAFRCNLVHTAGGTMVDYSAGAIESDDASALIEELKSALDSDTVRLYPGVSYRHLLVIRGFPKGELACTPPHDITGKAFEPHLPVGEGAEILAGLSTRARAVLRESAVNRRRAAAGKVTVTDIWLWGQGSASVFPKIGDRFGLSGSVITAVDLVRGLGRLAGLTVRRVEGATGYLDTNYAGKVAAATEALESEDLVYVHVEAPDETSHEGELGKKLRAIEDFDAKVVGPMAALRKRHERLRILVLPDHPTLLATKTHDATPVPFVVCGTGIEPDGSGRYCEAEAPHEARYSGTTLFEELVRGNFG
jgi:2,3-bisphosphoglycerate-independent phosphoglycerate mutase